MGVNGENAAGTHPHALDAVLAARSAHAKGHVDVPAGQRRGQRARRGVCQLGVGALQVSPRTVTNTMKRTKSARGTRPLQGVSKWLKPVQTWHVAFLKRARLIDLPRGREVVSECTVQGGREGVQRAHMQVKNCGDAKGTPWLTYRMQVED